jgi:hypothetical protein
MTRPSHWGVLSHQKLMDVWVKSCILCEHEFYRTCRKYRFNLNSGDNCGACKDFRIKYTYAPQIIKLSGVQPPEQVRPEIPEHWQIW